MPLLNESRRGVPDFAPYWKTLTGSVKLYLGEVCDVLAKMPARSVQMVVTSPPYWGLRDYGTGTWSGGDVSCDHLEKTGGQGRSGLMQDGRPESGRMSADAANARSFVSYKQVCKKCGAMRIDQQIGSEPSPDCGRQGMAQCGQCFVCSMVRVFRAVRRVLRDDGILWLNLGDSYSSGGLNSGRPEGYDSLQDKNRGNATSMQEPRKLKEIAPGNLVGVPWRVALALQANGWVLRSDIPWVKRGCMPESVTNRPAKALEYVFMFSKSSDYYFDMDAIKPPLATAPHAPGNKKLDASRNDHDQMGKIWGNISGRNSRNADLWYSSVAPPFGLVGVGDELVGLDVTSEAYPGKHFAVFSTKLIRPLILAGTSAHGACVRCGAPWRRIVEKEKLRRDRPNDYVKRNGEPGTGNSCGNTVAGVSSVTLGWRPTCACDGLPVVSDPPSKPGEQADPKKAADYAAKLARWEIAHAAWWEQWLATAESYEALPVRPCIVLDPFCGSGTTAYVCLDEGRHCWGIDLSEDYLRDQARQRIASHPSLRVVGYAPSGVVVRMGRRP